MTLRWRRLPLSRSRGAERRKVSTATFRSFSATASPTSGMEAVVHAVIEEHGLLRTDQPAYKNLYFVRARRGLPTHQLADELNGRHHLTRNDIVPFLVLLALETGLEIECCKELMVDCLENASNGTVEITYLKRRARGAEHKRLRVRDGGPRRREA